MSPWHPPSGYTELEFGVPIPGEILPAEKWSQTALKSLPEGLLNWGLLFSRQAPVVLDIGCGNGRYLLGSSLWRPDHDHLGTDILPVVIRYATRRGNQRGLRNLKFAVIGGFELLEQHVPAESVAEIHCYHPQPYYDSREYRRRLITPEFLALVVRSLRPGGKFFLQTDNPAYWRYMRSIVPSFFDFQDQPQTWPDAPRGRTRREILALKEDLPVFRGWGTAKVLTEAEIAALVQSLPRPTFNADRKTQRLDRLEKERG